MDEMQFLFEDISDLEASGLIKFHEYSDSGDAIYNLSRDGAELAVELPAVEIRTDPAAEEAAE